MRVQFPTSLIVLTFSSPLLLEAVPIDSSLALDNVTSFEIATTGRKLRYSRDSYWTGESFFDNFDFIASETYIQDSDIQSSDPTHGFVNYLDRETATELGIASITKSGNPRWGVDASKKFVPGKDWGRPSVRLESKRSWTHGIFVADIAHMPGAACGVWPAFWTLGSGPWPENGEIDILEGVNLNTNNQMVIHTGDNCTMYSPPKSALSAVFDSSGDASVHGFPAGNCAYSFSSGGCRAQAKTPKNYGDSFNENGGGIYILQWTSQFVRIWFFARDEVDQAVEAGFNLKSGSVDISKLGLPQAAFTGGEVCDIDTHLKEHRLIFDTTFCGDWAGSAWPSRCPSKARKTRKESCEIYVGENPKEYEGSYWEINSIAVFKEE